MAKPGCRPGSSCWNGNYGPQEQARRIRYPATAGAVGSGVKKTIGTPIRSAVKQPKVKIETISTSEE